MAIISPKFTTMDKYEDDEHWEDVDASGLKENQATNGSIPTAIGPGSRPSTPTGSIRARKRKPGKTIFVAASPRNVIRPASKRVTREVYEPLITTEDIKHGAYSGARFAGGYIFDVFGNAIMLLRKPLSVLLFLWFLSLIVSRISTTLKTAFAPLCIIPGISRSPLCYGFYDRDPSDKSPRWADYPKLMDVQGSTFDRLLDDTAGGSGLALEIKKAEMATGDLATVVRVSKLTSREALADSLVDFVEEARRAARGLQRLNAKVGGTVDTILAVNDHALRSIEAVHANSPNPYSLNAYLPWAPTQKAAHEIVVSTFGQAMETSSRALQRLILEAELSLSTLEKLEERLNAIHSLVVLEDASLKDMHNELLSLLWTKLGGNRRALRGAEEHLRLLRNVGGYRTKALAHVVGALQTLQSMSDDMEDLRERVAAPELIGEDVPVEVHMLSIKTGLERLKDGRSRAKDKEEEVVRKVMSGSSEVFELET